MLLAFGTSQHPQPTIIPVRVIRMLDAAVPLSAFVLSGIVVALTAVLWALYRWTRFGLATRAASENDVAARLAGLSPDELSLANTLLANLLLGTLGILAGSVAALDTTTLPFLVVPALAAALFARLTSFSIACACGLGIGMLESLIEYASTKSWFPTTDGLALPGVKELLVFVLIVAAMFLRGASLPTRGELVEQRLPDVPRPKHSVTLAIPSSVLCAIALVVLPFDFRQALTNSLIGIVMALSLVVITGFVGQISVVQLALAGVAGFTVSHLAVDAGIGFPLAPLAGVAAAVLLGLVTAVSALRVRGVRARRRHDRGRGRRLQLRLRQPHLGWRRDRLAGAGSAPLRHQPRADRVVPRPRRQPAEPRVRLGRARRRRPSRPPRRVGAPRHPGTTDACRPLERASRGRGGDQRPERQAGGVRHQRADRRRRRNAVRV